MNIPEYIKAIKRGLVCCGLLFTLLPYGHAGQGASEEVSGKPLTLYFRLDKALVDSGYMDNGRTLRHLDELLTDRQLCARIDSIHILSFTSPDGNRAYNDLLDLAVAVKTNLLFDAALIPNVEIEVPIGSSNCWSVNGEYVFPWWLFDKDKYCMQLLMGGLEGRYWLGSRKNRQQREVLTGHFLGLYAGGGKYDLQWDDNGYQGEFFIAAGVSYGWATRIARNLHLEFNIGIGLLRTDYRHYHARDNYQTLLWQENGRYTWFGPTKAKISLLLALSSCDRRELTYNETAEIALTVDWSQSGLDNSEEAARGATAIV